MKKITLFLGAVVLGFMLVSCGNIKDQAIKELGAYYDNETAEFNKVQNADDFWAYIDAWDSRSSSFFESFNKTYPMDSLMNFVGMSEKDNEELLNFYNECYDKHQKMINLKAFELYEPMLSDAENARNDFDAFVDQYDKVEDMPEDQLQAKFDKFCEKFDLASENSGLAQDTKQHDRYYALYQYLFEEGNTEE